VQTGGIEGGFAGAIMGIKKTCKTSDELRKEIHALIGMMIRI
jgi:hypothetical protein